MVFFNGNKIEAQKEGRKSNKTKPGRKKNPAAGRKEFLTVTKEANDEITRMDHKPSGGIN